MKQLRQEQRRVLHPISLTKERLIDVHIARSELDIIRNTQLVLDGVVVEVRLDGVHLQVRNQVRPVRGARLESDSCIALPRGSRAVHPCLPSDHTYAGCRKD